MARAPPKAAARSCAVPPVCCSSRVLCAAPSCSSLIHAAFPDGLHAPARVNLNQMSFLRWVGCEHHASACVCVCEKRPAR
eukprot:6843568-Pyramimonas_sp.AAC.1